MIQYKKIGIGLSLVFFMVIGIAATRPPEEHGFKNLKVLPKKIGHEDLGKVMDSWKKALGVKCNFCHAQAKDNSGHLDFASDEKPEKSMARGMYKMTAKINKKYFKGDKDDKGESVPAIACETCHHGNPHPEGGSHMEGGDHPDGPPTEKH